MEDLKDLLVLSYGNLTYCMKCQFLKTSFKPYRSTGSVPCQCMVHSASHYSRINPIVIRHITEMFVNLELSSQALMQLHSGTVKLVWRSPEMEAETHMSLVTVGDCGS